MIDLSHLRGHTVAVLGLGRSGMATVRALAESGVETAAWDDKPDAHERARSAGALVTDLGADLGPCDMLVLSPGIPRSHPEPHPAVAKALAAGIPVVSDIDLLAEAVPQARFLGITGTNGKSTTTALIGHILRSSGTVCAVGGNLGAPALALEPLTDGGWYVLELSSYQLETITRVPWDVGVFLNIAPDHLDRYPDMMAYVAAKTRLFDPMKGDGRAVIGIDDDWSNAVFYYQSFKRAGQVEAIAVTQKPRDGIWRDGDRLIESRAGTREPVFEMSAATALPGVHNAQNAAAAYAASCAVGIEPAEIARAMCDFPGLAHRQQAVATLDGVTFVNDSKATNPEAAARALDCYQRIHWIAGGRPKPGGLGVVLDHLGDVDAAYLIGEAGSDFAAEIGERVGEIHVVETLDRAVADSFAAARDGAGDATVLLSPACASFDQFRDFEQRGDRFMTLVEDLRAAAGEARAS